MKISYLERATHFCINFYQVRLKSKALEKSVSWMKQAKTGKQTSAEVAQGSTRSATPCVSMWLVRGALSICGLRLKHAPCISNTSFS